MTRIVRFSQRKMLLATLVAALAVTCSTANAQTKPFAVIGAGTAPHGVSIGGLDSPHNSAGIGTYLGKYSGDQGNFNALSFDPATMSGTFHGSFVFVGANGDKLACTYGETSNGAAEAGEFQVVDVGGGDVVVVFLAEFNPILSKCTGKFKDLTKGSFLMLALTEPFPLVLDASGFTPPFHYVWQGAGSLTFKKK